MPRRGGFSPPTRTGDTTGYSRDTHLTGMLSCLNVFKYFQKNFNIAVFHCPEMAQMMKGGGGMKMGPTHQQQPTQILQKPQVFIKVQLPNIKTSIWFRESGN